MGLNKDIADQEAKMEGPYDDRIWISYDAGLRQIEKDFNPLIFSKEELPFRSISEYVGWYREKFSEPPVGLEIAGQGKTFSDLGIDGVASFLAVPRYLVDKSGTSGLLKRDNTSGKIVYVEGDISDKGIWEKLKQCFEREKLSRPSIILYTPAGGISYIPDKLDFYKRMIGKITEFANPRSFMLLGEYPKKLTNSFPYYLNSLSTNKKYQVNQIPHSDGGNFMITKLGYNS